MKNLPYLFTLVLASLLSQVSIADDIDEIVVSGSQTPLTINQLGSSVSIISRQEIERREARNVAELLRSVPG
ncbi:MAG: TonB-dependent receptor plug domain-containing protein, partial [Woeseiaceae bacterium]|nr:TonB-dependent receptor plug domain-containing protein [Woeseiaceae bacterium]